MFTIASFIIIKNGNKANDRKMDKLCSIHTIKYPSAMERSKQSVTGADRKCYMLCDSTYMTFWKRQYYWTEINQWLPRDEDGGRE